MTTQSIHRDDILDVMRLVACLFIMLFHFYSLHLDGPTAYPYGDSYDYFPYGYLGVQFFLILSGFFLIPSLRRCDTFSQFVKKKIIRLWLPLLLCTIVTYVFVLIADTDVIYPEAHNISNFLFSLLCINPYWVNQFTPVHVGYINGAYWFMAIIVLFILGTASVFFCDKKHGARNIVIMSIAFHVFHLLVFYYGNRIIVNYFCNNRLGIPFSENTMRQIQTFLGAWTYPTYSIFCTFGLVSYLILQRGMTKKNIMALVVILVLFVTQFILIPANDMWELIMICVILVLWSGYIYWRREHATTQVMTNRFICALALLGCATYTAYLIHETIGVILIHKYAESFGSMDWILPIVLIACALLFGYASYKYIEQPIVRNLYKKYV